MASSTIGWNCLFPSVYVWLPHCVCLDPLTPTHPFRHARLPRSSNTLYPIEAQKVPVLVLFRVTLKTTVSHADTKGYIVCEMARSVMKILWPWNAPNLVMTTSLLSLLFIGLLLPLIYIDTLTYIIRECHNHPKIISPSGYSCTL